MSEPKFTPGQWLRVGNFVYELEHAGYRKGVEQFRNRFSISVNNDNQALSAGEIEAIARKVQALPKLFAALEKAVAQYGKPGGPWNVPSEPGTWIAEAKAAIARARGETP